MLRMLLHHDICSGMVLVALSPETTLTDLHRDQISHDVKYMWVLTENSSSESEQSVFGTDNLPFSSGDSEQIRTVRYQTFIEGVAGKDAEIIFRGLRGTKARGCRYQLEHAFVLESFMNLAEVHNQYVFKPLVREKLKTSYDFK